MEDACLQGGSVATFPMSWYKAMRPTSWLWCDLTPKNFMHLCKHSVNGNVSQVDHSFLHSRILRICTADTQVCLEVGSWQVSLHQSIVHVL